MSLRNAHKHILRNKKDGPGYVLLLLGRVLMAFIPSERPRRDLQAVIDKNDQIYLIIKKGNLYTTIVVSKFKICCQIFFKEIHIFIQKGFIKSAYLNDYILKCIKIKFKYYFSILLFLLYFISNKSCLGGHKRLLS